MDIEQVQALFSYHERRLGEAPGLERHATPSLVKLVAAQGSDNYVSWFQLDPGLADAAIQDEIDFFTARGQSFEWKVYDWDLPSDMVQRLVRKGFEADEPEALMMLDIRQVNQDLPDLAGCTELTTDQQIREAVRALEPVWQRDLSEHAQAIIDQKRAAPGLLSMYAVYQSGIPVCSARIVYPSQGPFASLWGGSTLAEHRGKGFYRSLLNRRINDARARKIEYLYIEASPMSQPILERYGFIRIAGVCGYHYSV